MPEPTNKEYVINSIRELVLDFPDEPNTITAEHQLMAVPHPSEPIVDRTTGFIIAGLVILGVAGYTLDKIMGVIYRK